jgi:long-chain acyl-CoA synthetase
VLNPYSLLPLALAARGGHVDEYEVQQLMAAGLTLLQRSAPLVRALSGKRAAILLPTSPQFFIALAACEGRGAVLIDPQASPSEISHQLADARVGAVFTNASLASTLPDAVPRVIFDDGIRAARVSIDGSVRDVDLGSHHGLAIEGDTDAAGSDEEAVIVYTSAMAGRPLGAVLSHRNLLANARSTLAASGNAHDDRVLALLPFSHLFGLTVTASAPLLCGATVVTMPHFQPSRAAELIANGEITEIAGVPTVFRALLAVMKQRGGRTDVGALRKCVCGGAPLPISLQDRWYDVTGIELRQGYGLTEAAPVILSNAADRANSRGTLGVPIPNVAVELRTPVRYDTRGLPLPGSFEAEGAESVELPQASDRGEICVRGDNVFRGYVSGGERGLPVRQGWLYTGDVGQRNEDGTISFLYTSKPMFTRDGFNVYPHEIELVVSGMPGVAAATARATGAADDDSELEIELTVRAATAGPHPPVTVDGVHAWCAAHLSAYKRPHSIIIL